MLLEEAFESVLQRFSDQDKIQAIYIDCRKRNELDKIVRVKLTDDTMYQLVSVKGSKVWKPFTI